MTPAVARHAAGPGARLVTRTGVLHVYTGPLTPSGRFIPRNARTVCRARTGRLSVVELERVTALADDVRRRRPRVCARCSARLTALRGSGRVEPQHRDHYRQAAAGLSIADLAVDLTAAATEDDVDHVVHIALAVHGLTNLGPLRDLVTAHRARVHIPTAFEQQRAEAIDMAAVATIGRRKAENAERWDLREASVARLGINLVKPHPTKGAPRS